MMNNKELEKFMTGKTIKSCEIIQGEWGRTYDYYMCLIFSDKTKILLLDAGIPYSPNPDIDEMKKAPNFFSPQDIADKVLIIEKEKRSRERYAIEWRKKECENLKKEFETE